MRRPWLALLVPLYAAGAALHARRLQVQRLAWPVVSVGNLAVGGAGKTPLTIALTRLLAARGVQVDVLSRGYGRANRVPARVCPDGTAKEFGDEPLLIARAAGMPVYVAARRYAAGRQAETDQHSGVDYRLRAHLLDDGFQHRQLARDVDILLLNREDWQDTLLPAGNLRETRRAARRASVIAIPAEDATLADALRAWGWSGPVWRLRRHMEAPRVVGSVLAFCGIARPEQFFSGLEQEGIEIAVRRAFRDHHRYSEHDMTLLAAAAKAAGATALVTTEKDAVRLGALVSTLPAALPLTTARLTVTIEDETAALDWLIARIAARQAL